MFGARTPLAVGAADLDGSQVVEKFLEVRVADGWPPGVVSAVMESNYDNKLGQTRLHKPIDHLLHTIVEV